MPRVEEKIARKNNRKMVRRRFDRAGNAIIKSCASPPCALCLRWFDRGEQSSVSAFLCWKKKVKKARWACGGLAGILASNRHLPIPSWSICTNWPETQGQFILFETLVAQQSAGHGNRSARQDCLQSDWHVCLLFCLVHVFGKNRGLICLQARIKR